MIGLDQTDSLVLRAVILYLPVATLLAALFIRRGSKRRTAAVVISSVVTSGLILAGNAATGETLEPLLRLSV